MHPRFAFRSLLNLSLGCLLLSGGIVVAEEAPATAATVTLNVDAANPGPKVSPMLYGLMTEEINHCYDGGLYAELIQNRVFKDDAKKPAHWSVVQADGAGATIALDKTTPLNENLGVSLCLDATTVAAKTRVGIANDGYWGFPVKPDTKYRASFHARAATEFKGPVTVALESEDGKTVYATAQVPALTSDWKPYEVTLKTDKSVAPTTKARFVITAEAPCKIWFNLVSLFPPTWKDQPNGFRPDLMQMLVDMKPAFLRFPGGNYLEGNKISERFEWKKTLGPLTDRPGHPCPWGYRSSDGMGLLEFLLWCEDMAAEPVLGVYAGYSLKGEFVKTGPDMEPYIQEALEEIEYVIGDKNTTWGARRIKDGHPEPFKLTYVEIGNEDFFDKSGTYDARFAQFYDAIKKKYPNLQCISSIGSENPAKQLVKSRTPDLLDEHYYRSAATFDKMALDHYDKYKRQGPKIFCGEWGAYEKTEPWNKASEKMDRTPSMLSALGDAAWMCNMERNSDLVVMHCYAPLLVNVNPKASQWRPNLIGYDAIKAYGSPSYYAIKTFSQNHGDVILKASFDGVSAAKAPLHYTVTKDSKTGTIYLKIVNLRDTAQTLPITIKGVTSLAKTAEAITITAKPEETNSMEEPTKVVPVTTKVSDIQPNFKYTFPAYSITILKLSGK